MNPTQDPNDDLTVSNAPTPINSTTATAPQASPTAGSPDNAAGAPNTPPQRSQQPQDASSSAGGPTSPPNAPSVSNSASHPAVQKASIVRQIAETLAGGPRTSYSIDPTTGAMTTNQMPLSTKQIGLAIAMAALSGGISGLGERGPGAEGRAAQAGFNQVAQANQKQDQEQQQQTSVDFARQAAIANTNFQTHQNALRAGAMEYAAHKQLVDDAAPVLQNLNDVGAVLESGVHESDLVPKYHVTKDLAVVDGIVPRMGGPNGTQSTNKDGSLAYDNTYSVLKPDAKIALPDSTAKLLASYRIPGYFRVVDGQAQPINFQGAAGIKAGLVVDGLATASALKITEASINQQLRTLGKTGDADAQQFEVNLKSSLADGTVTPKALKAFARYTGEPLDEALVSMQKDKVDPSLIGQIASLVPADARDQIKQNRVDAAKFSIIDSADKAQAVLAAPGRFSADQVSAAKNFISIAQSDSAKKATVEARAHAQATGADVEAMYRFGRNPITGETLSLANAAPGMLIDPSGNVIAQDLVSTWKPTSAQRAVSDTAQQVLAISQGLQAQIAANPALIGPLAGRSKAGLAALGLGDKEAQKLLDDVSLAQSAIVKMHSGARGSDVLLDKAKGLLNGKMNPDQFAGALQSINDVSQRYADEDKLTTVADYRNRQANQQSQPQQQTRQVQPKPIPQRQVQIPAGAQIGRDTQGNVVGYRLNGQYVPLNGGK